MRRGLPHNKPPVESLPWPDHHSLINAGLVIDEFEETPRGVVPWPESSWNKIPLEVGTFASTRTPAPSVRDHRTQTLTVAHCKVVRSDKVGNTQTLEKLTCGLLSRTSPPRYRWSARSNTHQRVSMATVHRPCQ